MISSKSAENEAEVRHRRRARGLAIALIVVLVGCALATMRWGVHGDVDGFGEVLRGWAAILHLAEPFDDVRQVVIDLRWRRVLVAVSVGASLALSGALLQGVFRNPLAAPSVLGLTAGANLGASIAILLMAGKGPVFLENLTGASAPLESRSMTAEDTAGGAPRETSPLPMNLSEFSPWWTTLFSLLGALATAFLVITIGARSGQVSVATLLLVGVAVNTCLAGILATIQSLSLRDHELSQAIFQWTFGVLSDRPWTHVTIALAGLAVAAAVIPFVARELDLFASGEEDAASLGVRVGLVKLLAVGAAAVAASAAVSVAGQIAFVGLVVPHLVRLWVGPAHRRVLPLALLGGAVFLLGTDVLQRWWFADEGLQPGVVMSLVGGPFFLALLISRRRSIQGL